MLDIAEHTVILREPIAMPEDFNLVTEKFCENWSFALKFNAQQLEKKIRAKKWLFVKIADGLQANGVGDCSREAIVNALKLVACHTSEHSNAAEVKFIELTHYPWFYLARVRACQYHIHSGSCLIVPDKLLALASAARRQPPPIHAEALYQGFGSVMPLLKQMLVLPIERRDSTGKSDVTRGEWSIRQSQD